MPVNKQKWIQDAVQNPGAFTREAKAHGMNPAEFQKVVLEHPKRYHPVTVKRARLRKTLVNM